jgi:hypothetical protein
LTTGATDEGARRTGGTLAAVHLRRQALGIRFLRSNSWIPDEDMLFRKFSDEGPCFGALNGINK